MPKETSVCYTSTQWWDSTAAGPGPGTATPRI